MGKSDELIKKAKREALLGPCSGSNLAHITIELCAEYKSAIEDALRLEAIIHRLTKRS